jgi:hypothetical protein
MATEKDAAANAASVETVAENESEIDKIKREASQWKQKFESSQGRLRVAEAQQGQNAESEERMMKYMSDSIQTVVTQDDPAKRAAALKEIGAEAERSRALGLRVTSTQIELDKLVTDSGMNWENDSEFADARNAWNSSKPEEAYRLASLTVREHSLEDEYTKNEDVDEIVETTKRNARQDANVVDTKTSTAASDLPMDEPKTAAELTNYLRIARQNGIRFDKVNMSRLVRGATQR